jgi:MarR family transcriptional regulator, organic hydroperoxide resistance regulator
LAGWIVDVSTIYYHDRRAVNYTLPVTADEDQDLFRLVFELSRRLMGELERQLANFDLTPAQAQLLRELDEPTPMVGAAERMHCDPSNVTGIVDRLERRGLVERKTTAVDRRVKQLELTDEGRRIRIEVDRIMTAMPALDALSAADRDTLRVLLARSVGEPGSV